MGDAYYVGDDLKIRGFYRASYTGWRDAQVGAIAACVAHRSHSVEPGIVTMPTGSGKTAVELALPHIFASRRTLVLVPTSALRDQAVEAFTKQEVLRSVQVLDSVPNPAVVAVIGGGASLAELHGADVVVAIPQTLAQYLDGPSALPVNLFDLVLVDEAHHAPSETWSRVIGYFAEARAFLFTATPRRRDGKALPGSRIYHYSVRSAIERGLFNAIQPRILAAADDKDTNIVNAVVQTISNDAYAQVPILARTQTIDRANRLAELYTSAGLPAETYHSRVTTAGRKQRLARWRNGETRVIVGVDALGEGIDFPDLRILAYHDKHKSDTATMQQIGRLARTSSKHPVPSVLITQDGGEEYPALTGALSNLYKEDADWATLLPGLIDAEIFARKRLHDYTEDFVGRAEDIELANITPLGSVELRDARSESEFRPSFFIDGQVPDSLSVGSEIAGYRVTLAQVSPNQRALYLCFGAWLPPKWGKDPALVALQSHLCVITWHPHPKGELADVLAVSATDNRIKNRVLEDIAGDEDLILADVERLQLVMDALPRTSVSNVGIRSTGGISEGVTQYANHSGKGVDRGLGTASMGARALGHVMIQMPGENRSINAGIAVEKGKYWELRNLTVLEYWDWITALVTTYWNPSETSDRPLVPALARGSRVTSYPTREVLFTEVDPELLHDEWRVTDPSCTFDDLEISATIDEHQLRLAVINTLTAELIWEGSQSAGSSTVVGAKPLDVVGHTGGLLDLADLLSDYPPTLWLDDGTTIRGTVLYNRPLGSVLPDTEFIEPWEWPEPYDITNEAGTSKSKSRETSIHARVESHLDSKFGLATRTWFFINDGPGELADHVVVHLRPNNTAHLELWHSKAANSKTPGLSHAHFQELCQQGIKSRRWIVDTRLWSELANRLTGNSTTGPALKYVGGAPIETFRAIVGIEPVEGLPDFTDVPPATSGTVTLVQPGLSNSQLESLLRQNERGEQQKLIDILAVARDVIEDVARFQVISS